MRYYPSRKIAGILGFFDLALSLVLTYQFLATYKIAYAVFAVAAIGLSVFILLPVLRNQVVEIINDSVIVHTFGEKNYLTIDNLTGIRPNKDGSNSYRFSKNGTRFQVTPSGYSDKEKMSYEFIRIFDRRSNIK
jgi:uncharacterized protein with PQ loop repeat